jgi:hypothetical protein
LDFEERSGTASHLLATLHIKLEHDIPLTTEEAAVLRGCAPETMVRERVRGGNTAPFIRIGRAIRYPARSFVAWLRERPAVRSTSEVASCDPPRPAGDMACTVTRSDPSPIPSPSLQPSSRWRRK